LKLARYGELGYSDVVAGSEIGATHRAQHSEYSEDGVDVSLIRWMLSLTPAQRLELLDERVEEILAIRRLNARR
jgi:hypothetical protein